MRFHFYNDESIQPDVYDVNGEAIDLPLVATQLRQRVEQLPLVTLTLRARHVELITCNKRGYPEVRYQNVDLVPLLLVSRVRYESEDLQGGGIIHLDIELSPNDEATVE